MPIDDAVVFELIRGSGRRKVMRVLSGETIGDQLALHRSAMSPNRDVFDE
jgi:hypothetical protein